MKAGFYEFEFTVAFIHDYLKKNEAKGQQAIVGMPTPMEEAHVGYDAKIATNGHVRFFQFKRPHYLQAGNGLQGEYYPDQPYYRINITPNEQSEQHNLIVNLAQSGAEVYYIAPKFHDSRQLDAHRSADQIMEQSIWVPTQDLPTQRNGDRSYITYLPDGTYTPQPGQGQTRRSEPRYEFPERTATTRRIDREYYANLLRNLEDVIGRVTGREPDYREMREQLPRIAGPDVDPTTTESDQVRFLLHSKFNLKAITTTERPTGSADQTSQH